MDYSLLDPEYQDQYQYRVHDPLVRLRGGRVVEDEICYLCQRNCTGFFHGDSLEKIISEMKRCIELCEGCDLERYGENISKSLTLELKDKQRLYEREDPEIPEMEYLQGLSEMSDYEMGRSMNLTNKLKGYDIVKMEMREAYENGANFVTWLVCKALEPRMGSYPGMSAEDRITAAIGKDAIHNINGEWFLTQKFMDMYARSEDEIVDKDWVTLWREATGTEANLNGEIDMERCRLLAGG